MALELSANPSSGSNRQSALTEEAVRAQLEKILASLEFKDKPMLRGFLRFVVDQTLAGQARKIKGYTVATEVFGRKEDFDPVTDPIVRIQAGRLRRTLERYYQNRGGHDPVKIAIPIGSYVPQFHPGEEHSAARVKPQPGAKEPLPADVQSPAIAVLPLVNLTGDPGQDYFTIGLTEELTSELARHQDLRVVSYHPEWRPDTPGNSMRDLAHDLGVRFLLEGSVRKDTDSIKISVRLVDGMTRVQLWGEQYRRELRPDSLIALQEEIGQQVAATLGSIYGIIPRLLSGEARRKPPESLAGYESFLRFFHYLTVMTPDAFIETLQALEHTVARDPESGLAWSLLAFLYNENYTLRFVPLETPMEKAVLFARKGVGLEPQNQLVRTALAVMHFHSNELESCLVETERALGLNPNAPAVVGFLGWQTALAGEWERGLAILRKGIEMNPYHPGWFHMAPCFYACLLGRYQEAYHEAGQFRMPQFFWDPLLQAAVLGQLGRAREAGVTLAKLLELKPDFPTSGPWLIRCFAKSEELVQGLLDGLRRAGLKL